MGCTSSTSADKGAVEKTREIDAALAREREELGYASSDFERRQSKVTLTSTALVTQKSGQVAVVRNGGVRKGQDTCSGRPI